MLAETRNCIRRIAAQWNEHHVAFDRASAEERWEDANYHAFMCDAIIRRIDQMDYREIVDEFYENARGARTWREIDDG